MTASTAFAAFSLTIASDRIVATTSNLQFFIGVKLILITRVRRGYNLVTAGRFAVGAIIQRRTAMQHDGPVSAIAARSRVQAEGNAVPFHDGDLQLAISSTPLDRIPQFQNVADHDGRHDECNPSHEPHNPSVRSDDPVVELVGRNRRQQFLRAVESCD